MDRPEIELPDTHLPIALRQVALSVGKSEAQLDELQHVHIAPGSPVQLSIMGQCCGG